MRHFAGLDWMIHEVKPPVFETGTDCHSYDGPGSLPGAGSGCRRNRDAGALPAIRRKQTVSGVLQHPVRHVPRRMLKSCRQECENAKAADMRSMNQCRNRLLDVSFLTRSEEHTSELQS